jgi:FkbM family methyltransferase
MLTNNKLKELVLEHLERSGTSFEAVQTGMRNGVALFGAGQFGRASLEYLRSKDHRVVCFVDNSPHKQGKVIGGIPVVSKDDNLATSAGAVLITAKHAVGAISSSLEMKIPKMSFDAWFVSKELQKYTHIRDNVFKDDRSRECLDGIMLAMLTGDEAYCAAVMDFNQYFCLPQFVNVGTESFVDAGAYVGDTVEKFILANNGAFRHIYAFEPCQQQLMALRKRKERLVEEWALNSDDFDIVNAGLGETDSFANINVDKGHLLGASLTSSVSGQTGSEVQVLSLDSYIKDRPVTFIKADIEGMEMDMLRGAVNTIRTNKPKMTLSVYHKPEDLISMVKFVVDIDKNYKVALRHHSPMLMDTTLYCWR